MLDRAAREALSPPLAAESDGESWLMSYLDVLTLLITLFVLLLALTDPGQATTESRPAERLVSPAAHAAALMVATGLAPQHSGLKPRHRGLNVAFSGLESEGVSVVEGDQGITLRIDNTLLFASGQAALTPRGRAVLQELSRTLRAFEGQISVEGHTDDVPIRTARFPSNWELSTGRATSVLRYLVGVGVPRHRLRAVGYADTRPLTGNVADPGRAANRRVELLLTPAL